MAHQEIEVILTRQLASYLAMPIFVVDEDGNLIYYHEPAEEILGCRFEETGEMPADELAALFNASEENGTPIHAGELPIDVALRQHSPSYRRFWIQGLDQERRCIEVTAFPLIGQANRFLGAIAVFWESSTP
jgi:PAS domain-containing protein